MVSHFRALVSAPGRIRTCDLRIRSPLLYPLSYRRRRQAYAERAGLGQMSWVNLGGVARLLSHELLESDHARRLDPLGIPKECPKGPEPCPRPDPRRVGQLSDLVESNDGHVTSMFDLDRADVRPVFDRRDIHVDQSSSCLDRHRRVLAQGSFESIRHGRTIGQGRPVHIGLRVILPTRRMPARVAQRGHSRTGTQRVMWCASPNPRRGASTPRSFGFEDLLQSTDACLSVVSPSNDFSGDPHVPVRYHQDHCRAIVIGPRDDSPRPPMRPPLGFLGRSALSAMSASASSPQTNRSISLFVPPTPAMPSSVRPSRTTALLIAPVERLDSLAQRLRIPRGPLPRGFVCRRT